MLYPPRVPAWFSVASVIFLVLATIAIFDWLVGGNEQTRGMALLGLFAWGVCGVGVLWSVSPEYVKVAVVFGGLGLGVLSLLALLVYIGPTGWALLALAGLGGVLWGLTRVFTAWLAKVLGEGGS